MTEDNAGITDIEALHPITIGATMPQGHQAPGRIKRSIYRTKDSTHV
jgi:hypothetical protein